MNRAHGKLLHGTTVIVIKTRNDLVVAADSKGRRGTAIITSESACKVGNVGLYYYAFAGAINDPETGFNILTPIKEAISQSGSIVEVANRYESMAGSLIAKQVGYYREKYRNFYDSVFKNKSASDVAFFGVEKDALVFHIRFFFVEETPDGKVTIQPKRIDCGADCENGDIILGEREEITKYMAVQPSLLKDVEAIEAVRTLIKEQIKVTPDSVGEPIDIVRLTIKRTEWIQRKKECEAKK